MIKHEHGLADWVIPEQIHTPQRMAVFYASSLYPDPLKHWITLLMSRFSSSNLHILCFLLSASNFGIVEPFPENIYPIEFTSAEVTVVAFDSLGEKTPEKILFMRKDHFATYTKIRANDSLRYLLHKLNRERSCRCRQR